MKSFGSAKYASGEWHVKAEPHVMIRLKAVMGRVDKMSFGEVKIAYSPEVCRDLEWFIARYPLQMDAESLRCLSQGADYYRERQERLERIADSTHVPRQFALALPPRDYQARAVEIYLERKSLLLGDQLGLGKSVTAIASLTEKQALPALVVCGTHLQQQWREYLNRFLPEARVHIIKCGTPKPEDMASVSFMEADVLIITYHKLAGWADVLPGRVKSLIFDECQELRHVESQKYKAALAIRRSASYAMGLSATPIYNYGGEIFNILEILSPGQLGTREEFEREWCQWGGRHWLLKDPDAFGSFMRDNFLMVRRTRADVGRELPAVQTMVQSVEFRPECLEQIDAVATELAHRILKGTFEEQGQAAREFDMRLRQATGIAKAPFVAAFVRMLIEECGEKVLLTGWHREVYQVWQAHFADSENPITPVFYTGTESPTQKNAARDRFVAGDCPLMIMSLRSGVGLDGLQEVCSTIVHGELDWSPGVHEQCRGRLFRDGQKRGLNEYFLVADGGSDPMVSEVLGLKRAQITGLLTPGASGLQSMQTDGGARVKQMAEAYLRKRSRRN